MTFLDGAALAQVYDDALERGYGLVASNVAEPSVLAGLVRRGGSVARRLLRKLACGGWRVAGGGGGMGEVAGRRRGEGETRGRPPDPDSLDD